MPKCLRKKKSLESGKRNDRSGHMPARGLPFVRQAMANQFRARAISNEDGGGLGKGRKPGIIALAFDFELPGEMHRRL